jgi:hypothetical protein
MRQVTVRGLRRADELFELASSVHNLPAGVG